MYCDHVTPGSFTTRKWLLTWRAFFIFVPANICGLCSSAARCTIMGSWAGCSTPPSSSPVRTVIACGGFLCLLWPSILASRTNRRLIILLVWEPRCCDLWDAPLLCNRSYWCTLLSLPGISSVVSTHSQRRISYWVCPQFQVWQIYWMASEYHALKSSHGFSE